jgi:hypothetical protein
MKVINEPTRRRTTEVAKLSCTTLEYSSLSLGYYRRIREYTTGYSAKPRLDAGH